MCWPNSKQLLDGGRAESSPDLRFDELGVGQLFIAHAVFRLRCRPAGSFADQHQQLDRRLFEGRLPAALFYNLMLCARKPQLA